MDSATTSGVCATRDGEEFYATLRTVTPAVTELRASVIKEPVSVGRAGTESTAP